MEDQGGFTFDLCKRNAMLQSAGMTMPKFTKTGTTIVGVVYKDGVVLGADTRSTNGPIVADKNCEKIHYIAKNMWCCGAGTAADTENTTALISSQLELHRLQTGREPKVATALSMLKQMLFKYQGHISAALILGGVDINGPSLYTIHPHGSTDKLPFVTMGSGSLAAMGIFEAGYKTDMEKEDAVNLVVAAIQAGIFEDLGSGSNVDVCVIEKGSVDMRRNMVRPTVLPRAPHKRLPTYNFPKGTTIILNEHVEILHKYDSVDASLAQPVASSSMDVS
jgi:20S proteasome subunit beta 2